MRIAVHGSHLCQDREDGNQTYIINLFKNLAQIDKNNEYTFYYNKECDKKVLADNFHHKVYPAPMAWTQRVFPKILREDNPDLLFMPIQMLPFLTPKNLKSVVTIHDVAFLYYPQTFPWKDLIKHRLYVRKAITASTYLISISEATKSDIVREYKVKEDKVSVVYHGIDKNRFCLPTNKDEKLIEKVKDKYGIKSKYILYVGNVQPRKNVQGLIKAFACLKKEGHKDWQLVVAGANAWLVDKIMQEVSDINNNNDIIFTGRFEDSELAPLLWGADLFVLPSFYEGFGLPILEAMSCGTPVLVSNTPSLVEIAGKDCVSFDPHNVFDIKQKLVMIMDDKKLQYRLIEQGLKRVKDFSWQHCAKQTLKVLNQTYHGA
jgi:glycosyltransferase involved in cell wall biosynthesis